MDRSRRFAAADYAAPGWYLVTAVTWSRRRILGTLTEAGFSPSKVGQCVQSAIDAIPHYRPWVSCLASCIMPDHVHLIVGWERVPENRLGTIFAIVGTVKSDVTRITRRTAAVYPGQAVWQRSFDVRFLRHQARLNTAVEYVNTNVERALVSRRLAPGTIARPEGRA